MASRQLRVEIIGDASHLAKTFGKANKSSRSFGVSLGALAKGGFAAGAGFAAAQVSIGTAVSVIKSSIRASREAEVAQADLKAAVLSAGLSYDGYSDKIETAIQKTSRLAAVDDEELSASFAKLVRTTKDVEKATDGMNLAVDIAAARHISLESATKIVERAMNGNTLSLKRVGVEVDKNTTSTQALERANKQFAGSAEAAANTSAGAQKKLSIAFENLQEVVGAKVQPALAKLAVKLTELIVWTEANWPKFQQAFRDMWAVVGPIVNNAIDRIQAIAKVLQATVQTIIAIKNGEWTAAWAGFKAVVSASLDAIVAFFVALPLKILSAAGRGAWSKLSQIGTWIKEAVLSGLEGIGRGVLSYIEGAINAAIGLLNGAINAYNAIPLAPNIPNVPRVSAGGGGAAPGLGKYVDKRAMGGPVSAGSAYLVGERGPELFVPRQSGGIVANAAVSAGGPVINVTVNGWVGNDQQIAGRIREELLRVGRRNGNALGGLA